MTINRWRQEYPLTGLPIKVVLGATYSLSRSSELGEKQFYYFLLIESRWHLNRWRLSPFPSQDYPKYETPHNTKTDKLPFGGGNYRPSKAVLLIKHYPALTSRIYMQEHGEFGGIPVPLTRTWAENAAPPKPLAHLWTARLYVKTGKTRINLLKQPAFQGHTTAVQHSCVAPS